MTSFRQRGGLSTDPMMPVVEIKNLVARYGAVEVLSDVSLRVEPGEVRVILGGSGCGKSTLLKHAIGLLRPTSGDVFLLDQNLNECTDDEREALMQRIGVLFQNGALLNSLTLHENVALPLQQHRDLPSALVDEIVRLKLSLVGLEHAANRMPRELSGGMQKRAALARAMALDPEVIFCDEPSAGLDPVTAAEIDQLILALRDRFGMTFVVVTHELESIKTIADTVTMLSSGKVLADGRLDDVQERARQGEYPAVHAFFTRDVKSAAIPRTSVLAALQREMQ